MNILFVYTTQDAQSEEKPLQRQENIAFGISYISSYLKTHGHITKLFVSTRSTNIQNIDKLIDNFKPKLICFSATATQYPFALNISKHVKSSYPDIFLIIGGTHITIFPEEALNDMKKNSFNALCLGEGEKPLFELVEQLEKNIYPTNINNLWIKNGKNVEKNPTRPFIQDLDSLPFPDKDMWQELIYYPDSQGSILLGRGCPYLCTYCSNHAIRKVSSGKYVRTRSPENIIKELEETSAKFPKIQSFHLEIETFGVNLNWALELCGKLEELNTRTIQPLKFEVNLRITPNSKPENLDNLFKAMKKCNIQRINVGLESGSERVRRDILKRNESNEDILLATNIAKKYGLKVNYYVLIGIVGETINDFKETIDFCREANPSIAELQIFFPYPGCDLYLAAKEQGLLGSSLDPEMERYKATLDLPDFSRKQIQQNFVLFEYNVFKGRRHFYKIALKVASWLFRSNYYSNKFYRMLTSFALFYRLKEFLLKPEEDKT